MALSRSHEGSSSAHAVQNGSVRLQAVDNIAKRVCAGSHRPQRGDQIVGKSGRLVRYDPAIDGESANGIVAARQRQHARAVLEFEPINVVDSELGAGLEQASRTRRTASALWRCAGQATTLNTDPA